MKLAILFLAGGVVTGFCTAQILDHRSHPRFLGGYMVCADGRGPCVNVETAEEAVILLRHGDTVLMAVSNAQSAFADTVRDKYPRQTWSE